MSLKTLANSVTPSEPAEAFSRWQRIQLFLISLAGCVLVRAIGATLHYQIEGWENFQKFKDERDPIILSFWHNQIFLATFFWRNRNMAVLTSQHFDGEYITKIINRFGYQAIRGSATRGGVTALLRLKKRLSRGQDLAIAADGPRGPIYQAKRGALWLSRRTGKAIIPCHMQPKRFWRLGSWDQFRIPKPFSPVFVKIGTPLVVKSSDDEGVSAEHYQGEMVRIQELSEGRWFRSAKD